MRHTLALCCALLFAPLLAQAAPERRAALEGMLSDYEHVPRKAALDRFGPDVAQLLRQIVSTPSRRQLARTRAIALLGYYPSAETAAVLEQVMAQAAGAKRGLPLLDLRQALGAYAAVKGPAAVERLSPYLGHPQLDVRLMAVKALASTKSAQAAPLLRQRLPAEPAAAVRQELQAQLERLQRAPAAPGKAR